MQNHRPSLQLDYCGRSAKCAEAARAHMLYDKWITVTSLV